LTNPVNRQIDRHSQVKSITSSEKVIVRLQFRRVDGAVDESRDNMSLWQGAVALRTGDRHQR